MTKGNGSLQEYLVSSSQVLLATAETIGQRLVDMAAEVIISALSAAKPLLVCGNGGSAADAMHLTAELVGCYLQKRQPLKALCLSENPAFLTAWSNDCEYDSAFARQVEAYGEPGAVLLGISTSGNSASVIAAFRQARKMKITTIALTGAGGGQLAALADYLLEVPSPMTPLVQQVHVCIYHYLCQRIEEQMFGQHDS